LTFPQAGQPVVVDPDDPEIVQQRCNEEQRQSYGGSATLSMQLGDVTSKTDPLAPGCKVDW
jgi:hypothetical protein